MDTDDSKESLLFGRRSAIFSGSSSGSFSGYTHLEVEDGTDQSIKNTICNRLEGALITTNLDFFETTVDFHFPAIFNHFLVILHKEYIGQANTDKDIFKVTSHFHKKAVHLCVNETKRTVKISGTGHKLWYEEHFLKRIAINLYKALLCDPWSDKQDLSDGTPSATSTPTGSHTETRRQTLQVSPVTQAPSIEPNQPPGQQITAIMDMIHSHSQQISTLQSQLINLCNEVARLKEQQVSKSIPTYAEAVTSKDNSSTQREDDTTQDPQSHSSQMEDDATLDPQSHNYSVRVINTPKGPGKQSRKTKDKKNIPRKETPQANVEATKSENCDKTLIIGDSLIKGINEKGLGEGTHCVGVSGAKVDTITEKIRMFDLSQFSTVVISVGGNDVSNRTDPEYFQEKLDQLVSFIKQKNPSCEVILCSICARSDCDVTFFNDVIQSIALDLKVKTVSMENFFSGKDKTQISRYFAADGIHLSLSGVRRFLDAIEKSCKLKLVTNFSRCTYYVQSQRQSLTRFSRQTHVQRQARCQKCGESNHTTFECRHRVHLRCYGCGSLGHKQSKCERF